MADHDIYPQVISQALTTLGVNNIDGIAHYYNKRLFQCMAAGRFHITKYVVGMERDFKKGVHCDWFDTIEEAVDMLAFYLQDRELTRKKGIAGAILLEKEHSWPVRAKQYRKIIFGENNKENK
jgi:spore maturation protein CgeB